MIRVPALQDYLTYLFTGMGCEYDHARAMAESMVVADLRGAHTHGLARLRDYQILADLQKVNVCPDIRITYQSPSTATVDGDNGFGPVVAKFAMDTAIEKARHAGTGWVAVRGSSLFGIGVYFARLALENDMVGVVMTNGQPIMAPVNGTSKMLGVNPISVAIPATRNPPLIYDFATAPVTKSKLEALVQKGRSIPDGLLQDAIGKPTNDASTIGRGGAIRPLGGDVDHGGHKGFCIASLVDIFSSLFSGANYGPFVPPEVAYLPIAAQQMANGVGHFVGAMRIDAFRPAADFKAAMDEWIDTFRDAKGKDGTPGIILPGEQEEKLEQQGLKLGLKYSPQLVAEVNRVAETLEREPMPYDPD
ncbi:MAG: malate dehydrogenase [Bacteroidetes bacterium]|nr:MAG: malate dehydrogenase [Bacteroidota bacterium]